MKKIAVITGASSGMGREFVYAVDKEFQLDEIWVIARRKERLEELQGECKTPVRPISLVPIPAGNLCRICPFTAQPRLMCSALVAPSAVSSRAEEYS